MIGRTHSEGQSFGSDRSTDSQYSTRKGRGKVLAMLALLTSFAVVIDGAAAGIAPTAAVLPRVVVPVLPSSTQFDITGFPTAATVDTVCVAAANAANPLDAVAAQKVAAHCGGTVTINGHVVVVPAETIAIMPAAAFTWEELFFKAPAPYGLTVTAPNTGPTTGMALTDFPKPLTTYEFQAVGNRVINGAGDRYIAGLIHVSQSDLNVGAGYISYIDYLNGVMEVGGTVLGSPSPTAARVMINDPALGQGLSGRYGRAANPAEQDPRFMVDQENPTITSATGYPMCLPRVTADPQIALNPDDAQCPLTNRPIDIPTGTFQQLFTMNNPNLAVKPVGSDPLLQAPFEVGDYITFSGSLAPDPLVPTGTMISAHTIVDNTAIFTADGTDPAYIMIEVSLIGTGGLQVFGAGEATIRTRFEGKSTDRTRPVYLYGIDYNANGSSSDRYFGTIMPDPGPPNGAVTGRWRFRPPCAQFGVIVTKPDKQCVNGPDNSFLPPPRELRAVIAAAGNDVGANPLGPPPLPTNLVLTAANGITYGQYHAPIGEYLFPENRPGNPVVENNFNSIPFLAAGGYSSNTGTVAGQLNPWPSNALPIPACSLPVPNIGTVQPTAASGEAVFLSASSTGTSPTYAWSTTPAVGGGTFSNTTIANPTWTAPSLAQGALPLSVILHFTVSNACAVGLTSSATVIVSAPPAPVLQSPTVNQVPALSMFVSQTGTFTVSGSDPNVPASLPLTFTVTGAGAPLVSAIATPIGGLTSTSASVQLITSATPGTVQLTITATNSTGQSSAPITATLTVSAAPADVVTITSVIFRTLKLRLLLTVTDAPAGNAVLKLQPYEYVSGGVTRLFNPLSLGTGADTLANGGGGLYTMSLVGAPQPKAGATITVKSSAGGSGSTTAITIRL